MPPIRPELLDELLKDYKKPDDLLGQDGLLQQLTKALVERAQVWPLPKDVKEAMDEYLRLDRRRREISHSGGDDAYLFQPHVNYRTLEFSKPLSARMVQKVVKRWAVY